MAEPGEIVLYGLGSMGGGMARSLLRAGLRVRGVDPDEARERAFIEEGGADTPVEQALERASVVVCVVLNAAQTESVFESARGAMAPGAAFMSCATVPPDFARRMEARAREANLLWLDAPISGGSIKAAEGRLSIMASGAPEAFEAAGPALEAMAETVFHLGDAAGAGSAMKAVNQLMAGAHIAVAAEGVAFALSQGIEPAKTLEVISKCAGSSWMFENRAPHIVAGDYTPHSAVDIWLKDLGIVMEAARASRFSAPLCAAALQQFVAASGSGLGGEDDAAVVKVYARNAALKLPGDG